MSKAAGGHYLARRIGGPPSRKRNAFGRPQTFWTGIQINCSASFGGIWGGPDGCKLLPWDVDDSPIPLLYVLHHVLL